MTAFDGMAEVAGTTAGVEGTGADLRSLSPLELAQLHRRASIYDVAHKAAVSIVTVSRVFNDYPHVSENMRKRVLAAARQVGYTPRVVSKRNILAVVVGDVDMSSQGPTRTRLLLDILRVASDNGYLVEYIPQHAIDLVTKHLADGLIEVGLNVNALARLSQLPPVPRVAVNKGSCFAGWSSVYTDHEHEAAEAARHLIARGHTRLALVLDDHMSWASVTRRLGFEKVIAAHPGLEQAVLTLDTVSPREAAAAIVAAGCTGLVHLAEGSHFALLDALVREEGRSIPGDLSVVGLEVDGISGHYHPRLTTMAQPLRRLAESAVLGLIAQLRNGPGHETFVSFAHSTLIERESVRALA